MLSFQSSALRFHKHKPRKAQMEIFRPRYRGNGKGNGKSGFNWRVLPRLPRVYSGKSSIASCTYRGVWSEESWQGSGKVMLILLRVRLRNLMEERVCKVCRLRLVFCNVLDCVRVVGVV